MRYCSYTVYKTCFQTFLLLFLKQKDIELNLVMENEVQQLATVCVEEEEEDKKILTKNIATRKNVQPHTAHRSIYSTSMARQCSKIENPFAEMKIKCTAVLDQLKGRSQCRLCLKSRKFFCYSCCVPVPQLEDYCPSVQLPCDVDVIKHPLEVSGKSTSTHGAVLAPQNIKIFTHPDIPDYSTAGDVVLVYPSADALPIDEYLRKRGSEIKKFIVIDSTWFQAKKVQADPRLTSLPRVVISEENSLFWRYQRGKPDSYLSTIEAIYYTMVQYHKLTIDSNYDGRYDDLLFFFKHLYEKIGKIYFGPE